MLLDAATLPGRVQAACEALTHMCERRRPLANDCLVAVPTIYPHELALERAACELLRQYMLGELVISSENAPADAAAASSDEATNGAEARGTT